MPQISIIIINYNRFDLTENCIESIYKYSKDVTFEIILVDNNSTVGSSKLIEEKYTDIIWIKNNNNMGFSYANNQGLKIAGGKFVLFLNNDTLFIENTLLKVIDFYKTLPGSSLIGCKLLNLDLSHQDSVIDFDNIANLIGENFFLYKIFPKSKKWNRFYLNKYDIIDVKEVDIIKGAFIFGESKIIKEMMGFDTRFYFYSEECDLCKRFKNKHGKVYYYPLTSIIHLGGATTDNMPWFSIKNLSIGKIQFFQKHFNGLKFYVVLLIHYCGILIRVPIYFVSGLALLKSNLIKKAYLYCKLLFIYPKNLFN
ncbi:MAG: glycosyltransferase family 2 protein [bacterium]